MTALRGTAQSPTHQGITLKEGSQNCLYLISNYTFSGIDPVVCGADGLTGDIQKTHYLKNLSMGRHQKNICF